MTEYRVISHDESSRHLYVGRCKKGNILGLKPKQQSEKPR